jgi:RNA polymerase sigma-70 factor (ECF subfamily)
MKSLIQAADEDIIRHIKATGEKDGFAFIYQRYAHILLGWCLRYLKKSELAEDAVMDIMEQLMQNIQKYEIKDFKNWLFLVARNHCFLRLRGKTEVLVEDINKMDGQDFVEFDKELHLKNERIEEALHHEIENLTTEQKKCVVLFYFHKKSYKEIEDITGFELKKVKSYIQNGKRNLKIGLEKKVNG